MQSLGSLGLRAWLLAAAAATPAVTAPDAAGRWHGTIHVPGTEVEAVVDLARNDSKAWIGSIVAPALALPGTPVSELSVEGAEIRFTLKGVLGDPRFEGRLREDGTLAGNVLLGGNQAPFELRRTGAPEVETPPRSTPVGKPFEGVWSGRTEMMGNPLLVRLTLGNDPAGAPAVKFFIQGHNPHEMAVDLVTQEGSFVSVHTPDLGGVRFEGRLNADAKEIAGVLQQGPAEAQLVLRPEAAGGTR
jgi:uncharacterized protein